MSFGIQKWYFERFLRKPHYKDIPNGLLITNWIFQRVFGINNEVPFSVHYTSKIKFYTYMNIPDSSKISFAVSGGCYIKASPNAPIIFGENCIFAPNVVINTGNHDLMDRKKYMEKEIIFGKNCWIAANTVVSMGVKLGDNCTVGAMSFVNKSFSKNTILAGSPAIEIKKVIQ